MQSGIYGGSTPLESDIWKSIKKKDIPRSIRGFLWKCLHGCYKIGDFWMRTCPLCGETETMQHILLDCPNSIILDTVWPLVRQLWSKRETSCPLISFGSILGAGLADFRHKGKRLLGKNRLFQILVLESAHLIWKIRCPQQMGARYQHPLKFDRLQTDTKRYGSKALKIETVSETWKGLLMNEENLPETWIWKSGVLVGIPPHCPPGRRSGFLDEAGSPTLP
ncbi:hypothetical protein EDD15DRAFT_2389828 [Pisolithus albus]|nr:hypothetical protein EDD15DRAFT_2389828 [Pisolithus albus]